MSECPALWHNELRHGTRFALHSGVNYARRQVTKIASGAYRCGPLVIYRGQRFSRRVWSLHRGNGAAPEEYRTLRAAVIAARLLNGAATETEFLSFEAPL